MTLRTQHEKPVYVRLRETIADAILAGKYGDGDPLPSVRALAAEEQANPLTVAKAYQGFQDEGLIVVKRGVGMFVARAPVPASAIPSATASSRRNGPKSAPGCGGWGSIPPNCWTANAPDISGAAECSSRARCRRVVSRSTMKRSRKPRG